MISGGLVAPFLSLKQPSIGVFIISVDDLLIIFDTEEIVFKGTLS